MPLTYQHTLATVWKLGFEKLSHRAILLLNVLATLDCDRIPGSLFQVDSESELLTPFKIYL